MSFRTSAWFSFVFFLVFSAAADSIEICSKALLQKAKQSVLIEVAPFRGNSAAIKEVFPGFNREEDILFFFFSSGHAGMYIGDAYVDRRGTEGFFVRRDAKAFQPGVAIHMKLGKEKTSKLLDAAQKNRGTQNLTCSCQHDHLYFLQRNGIVLNGPIPFSGVALYQRAVLNGFVDEKGKPIPYSVAAVGSSVQVISNLNEQIKKLQVIRTLQYLGYLGIRRADINAALRNVPNAETYHRLLDKIEKEALRPTITQEEIDAATGFYDRAETAGSKMLREKFGDDHEVFANRLPELRTMNGENRKGFILKILQAAVEPELRSGAR